MTEIDGPVVGDVKMPPVSVGAVIFWGVLNFLSSVLQLFIVSYFSSSFKSWSLTMERLREHGIDLNTPTSEYLYVLVSLSFETQLSI